MGPKPRVRRFHRPEHRRPQEQKVQRSSRNIHRMGKIERRRGDDQKGFFRERKSLCGVEKGRICGGVEKRPTRAGPSTLGKCGVRDQAPRKGAIALFGEQRPSVLGQGGALKACGCRLIKLDAAKQLINTAKDQAVIA